jgi:hypothetical protein
MAHECPECGYTCHCRGDIDDLVLEPSLPCTCCLDKYDDEEHEYLSMWGGDDWGDNDE